MRTAFFFVLFISFLFLNISCDQGTQTDVNPGELNFGALSFSLATNSIPSEVRLVAARLERTGYQTIRDSVVVSTSTDTVKFQLKNVPAGSWLLTVDARDSVEYTRYTGKATISVTQGQTTQVLVYMTPTSPTTGTVEIVVAWTSPTFRWMMSAENPIFRQTQGGWDDNHFFFDDPSIIKINNVYRMWYASATSLSVNGYETFWIAYATSSDGIHWTKHGPVLYPGPVGSWMEKGVLGPTVIYENGIYKMWFEGQSNSKYHNGIGYATSSDGLVWAVKADPVVRTNTVRPETRHPLVFKRADLYNLYFSSNNITNANPLDMYLMTSTDGIVWTERGKTMSARQNIAWEKNGIVAPDIIYDNNRYRMFYTGYGNNSSAIGYAESLDGFNWSVPGDTPALSSQGTSPWSTIWVGYCTSLKENGRLKLWFSGLTSQPYRWQIGYAEHVE